MSTQDRSANLAANTVIVEAFIKLALVSEFVRDNPGAEITETISDQLDHAAQAQPTFVKEAILYGMMTASAKALAAASAGGHWGCPDIETAQVVLSFATLGIDVMDMPLL